MLAVYSHILHLVICIHFPSSISKAPDLFFQTEGAPSSAASDNIPAEMEMTNLDKLETLLGSQQLVAGPRIFAVD